MSSRVSQSQESRVDVAALRRSVYLPEVVESFGVKLTKRGRDWWGCCPFHAEKSPSFSVFRRSSGEWSYCCFGCGEKGDAIKFVQSLSGVGFVEACKRLSGGDLGAFKRAQGGGDYAIDKRRAEADKREERRLAKRASFARDLYAQGLSNAWPLEVYLRARGIDPDLIGGVPDVLRFSPQVRHSGENCDLPAMLAPIVDERGNFQAVHRTYLRADFKGKAAIAQAKMVLGKMRGGVIRLGPLEGTIMLAEGIESALSVRAFFPDHSVWAAVSLTNFSFIRMPAMVKRVIILADNDMKAPARGQVDPKAILEKGARAIAAQGAGRKVSIAWPYPGQDFNDMLKSLRGA